MTPAAKSRIDLGVHRDFDAIAMDAEGIGMPRHSLKQLSDVLRRCVACHSRYQVEAATTR